MSLQLSLNMYKDVSQIHSRLWQDLSALMGMAGKVVQSFVVRGIIPPFYQFIPPLPVIRIIPKTSPGNF